MLDFKNVVTLKYGSEVTQGHQSWHRSIRHLWLPISYTATMSLSHTISEINSDFSRKLQIFQPRVFCAPAEGVPLRKVHWRWG